MQSARQLLILIVVVSCFLVLLVTALSFGLQRNTFIPLQLHGKQFQMSLADSDKERERGLSETSELKPNRGMLFVFEENGFWGIWMKDMRYPIDILWLNERKEVVYIEENIAPDTYPRVFAPRVPARYVIELRAGSVHEHGISEGDKATFRLR